MGYMKYKGYTGSVEYSEEDNCLFGKVMGLSKDAITYEGQTVDELRQDFEGAIDDYLESCAAAAWPRRGLTAAHSMSECHQRFTVRLRCWRSKRVYPSMPLSARCWQGKPNWRISIYLFLLVSTVG